VRRATVTVLKADISGSTPLGERLDPEELRSVLGAYFGALAREIQRHGGRVDKYIGDAVMAVFGLPESHADDAARAIRAALAMQEAIAQENLGLEARYGVRLSLRIGVNTGELVAPDTGELTLMGDVVTVAESMEAAAPLNTVLVSASTRAAAARRFSFRATAPVKFKGRADTIPAFRPLTARKRAADRATTGRAAQSASLQVGGQKEHILQEERKVVTVLFADVVVSEGDLAPDRQRAVLGGYFANVAHEIERFGGTVDKYIGDAVMAVFGAPVSHDDDGARAIAAGLAIQASIRRRNDELHREHNVRLAARVGVNTGEVVAGMLQGDVVAYTVTGDAVNTAQRIESAAALGEVLVSESTRVMARGSFQYEAVLPLTLKGKSQPVPAYRVVRSQRGTTVEGPALVGRETELAWLHQRFALAAAGLGQTAHLVGEAGVGKSRIVSEFVSTLPSTTNRLEARANSYETATPYSVLADLFRRDYGVAPTDDQETAEAAVARGVLAFAPEDRESAQALLMEVLGYGSRSALGPDQKRRLLISLVREFIAQRSRSSSVILVEDTHWMDPTSGELLASVVGQLEGLRCFVLTTSREPLVAWPADTLPVEPLADALAAEMVDRVAGSAIDPATRALVLERTGGNPFFIEEVVRSLGTGGSGTVPASVQDMLEARLDRLDEGPRLVAQRASVIGRTFSLPLLQRIVARPDVEAALLELVAERLIATGAAEPEPTFTFSHALVQEVAYRTQLISARRRAHVGVGDAISALYAGRLDEFVDVLAYQYGRGDDDGKAVPWLVRAGHRAQHLYANAEALDYFGAAVQRAGADPVARAEAHEASGDVLRVIGRYDDALAAYASALATTPEPEIVGRARMKRKTGIVEQLHGQAADALATFEDALAHLPVEATGERARVLLNIADLRFRDGQTELAIRHLTEALGEAERTQDDEARAEALKQLGTIHAYKGELARALDFQERSLDAFVLLKDMLGEANVHNNIGRTERRRSRHAEALAAYERALAIRQRIGDQMGRVHSHGNIAEIHFLRGELNEAQRHYDAAVELSRSIGYAFGVSASLVGLGATSVARGHVEEGIAQLRDAIADFERVGQRTYIVEALRDLTDGYIALRSTLALDAAERGVQLARELDLPELIAIALQALGSARLAAGEPEAAAVALEEARGLLERGDDRHELGRTLALLARVYEYLPDDDARHREAGAIRAQARQILGELGAALDLQRLMA
jgi:class 3 adenylate cyclase/tetratricopeptide (TPR) repeat protein